MSSGSDAAVSILLPAFDAEATLPGCLHSIERQTERRWQCVIVNDGSTDGTRQCAERFAARDPRFEVVSTPHRGLVAALTTGIAACRARYVARMDADDLMHRRRLEHQIRALDTTPALAAVGSHVRMFPRRHLREGRRAYESWLNGIDSAAAVRREMYVECPIAHPTLCMRRAILHELGYRDQGWPEDYDLILRLLTGGLAIGVVPRRLVSWRDTPARLTRTNDVYARARFTDCKAAFLAGSFLAAAAHYVLWGYGETGRALRRALLAHGKHPSTIIDVHPGRLGNVIHGAPVVAPEHLSRVSRQPVVVAVADDEARPRIRACLETLGLRETRDFVCAA